MLLRKKSSYFKSSTIAIIQQAILILKQPSDFSSNILHIIPITSFFYEQSRVNTVYLPTSIDPFFCQIVAQISLNW